jgi:hypothetical protein
VDCTQSSERHGTSQSTIDAVIYGVKARGVHALKNPANVDRLSTCDDAARGLGHALNDPNLPAPDDY